jgi:hypothetical protein
MWEGGPDELHLLQSDPHRRQSARRRTASSTLTPSAERPNQRRRTSTGGRQEYDRSLPVVLGQERADDEAQGGLLYPLGLETAILLLTAEFSSIELARSAVSILGTARDRVKEAAFAGCFRQWPDTAEMLYVTNASPCNKQVLSTGWVRSLAEVFYPGVALKMHL